MVKRWILAIGAALILAFLTLPVVPGFSIESFPLFGGSTEVAAVCEVDAKPAPMDFTLQDMEGVDVDLSVLKGNVILLNFWATWCGPCKIEIPDFIELQDEYRDEGFIVLGVSVDDTPEQIKPFAEEFAVNYPMLVGLGREDFQEAWGPIWGLPVSFWIDREGIWCKSHLGLAAKDDLERDLKSLL